MILAFMDIIKNDKIKINLLFTIIAIHFIRYKFGNIKVDDVNEDFSLDLSDGPFNFNIQVHNKKNKNMAIVSCIEKTKKLSKSFNVAREDKENPFYFKKYVPKK